MADYNRIEDQELFDERMEYLSNVTKEDFLKNEDCWFYARQVQAGTIPACVYVKKAVERELKKLDDPDCEYEFDPAPGARFFIFCRYFYVLEGSFGKFILADWQIWLFAMLLGWKHKETGYRQYQNCYIEVPRGSGKTTIMSLFELYMLTCDGEWTPEVYVAATKKDQAKKLFDSALRQIEFSKNKKLINHLKLTSKRDNILCTAVKGGKMVALSRDSKSMDGMNVHCAVVDEIHAHPDSKTWDVLKSGSNKRKQAIMVGITTAGHNLSGFGAQMSSYTKKMLTGEYADNPKWFGCVWTVDKGDDLYSPLSWIKANPGWWYGVNHDNFEQDVKMTKDWPERRSEIFTKLLNVWYQSNDKWLEPEIIAEANKDELDENDFKNCPCIVGVDLAYAEDMLAYVNVYEKYHSDTDEYHYYVFPNFFTPQSTIDRGDRPNYIRWSQDKILNVLPGDIIDFNIIQSMLQDEWKYKNVIEFAFDRYNAHQMAGTLQNKYGDESVFYVNQSTAGLNEASKFFKRLVLQKRIHFHNDVFVWNCLNATVRNYNGLIKIEKDPTSPKDKIDGLAACINALDRWLIRSVEDVAPSISFV